MIRLECDRCGNDDASARTLSIESTVTTMADRSEYHLCGYCWHLFLSWLKT